ncbi:MAG: site-specific DNA-methyltransferase [Ginsengibacter sp.]
MATGTTINSWNEEVQITSSEIFPSSFSYQLCYEGKTPIEQIIKKEAEFQYDELLKSSHGNKLFYGDNLDVLQHLIKNKSLKGKIKLVYIDPPYATNSVFRNRNQKDSYKDDLIGSHYIEFLRKRLILLHQLISDDGAIYLHLDNNMIFESKLILDEVFGKNNYRGLITRKKCSNKNSTTKTYGNISDYILFYSKTETYTWHRPSSAWTDEKIQKEYPCIDQKSGRKYKKVPIHAPGIRNGETGKEWKGMLPPNGKHWQYTPQKLDDLNVNGDIYWSATGNPRRKVYLDEDKGIPIQDIWLDVQDSLNQNIKTTGYPTEKNPHLLERIIKSCTTSGDIVLDCFAGSGTTCDLAEQLGRKWIGIDNSSEAIENIFKRFINGLEIFGDYVQNESITGTMDSKQSTLFEPTSVYNANLSNRIVFSFYSDSRYVENIREQLQNYFQKISETAPTCIPEGGV